MSAATYITDDARKALEAKAINVERVYPLIVRSVAGTEARPDFEKLPRGMHRLYSYFDSRWEENGSRIRLDARIEGQRFLLRTGEPVRPWIAPVWKLFPESFSANIYEDTSVELFIVEGIDKALSLISAGIPAIAMGGVSAGGHDPDFWLEGEAILHQELLSRIKWRGRRASILFDAGRANNPKVAKGEARLAAALGNAGALVRLAELPRTATGGDQGPDDFIARHGKEALVLLLSKAVPAAPLDRIHELCASNRDEQDKRLALLALVEDLPFLVTTAMGGEPLIDQVQAALRGYVSAKIFQSKIKEHRRNSKPRASTADPWRRHLLCNKQGVPLATVGNVHIILSKHPDWVGVLGFDLFGARIVFRAAPPFGNESSSRINDTWREEDSVRAVIWLEQNETMLCKSSMVREAVSTAARVTSFNSLHEDIESASWDGVPRAKTWLIDYMGAEDNDYTRAVGEKFLISMMARAYRPGCQVKYIPVLEGPQDLGKSKAICALVGEKFFTDEIADIGSKDAAIGMQGKWVLELAELAALKGSTPAKEKAFLSRNIDRHRALYERDAQDHPRQWVIIATTNEGVYLQDATGGVRFWPIKCTKADAAGIARDRAQLLAEALHLFRAGETWHLEGDLVKAAREEQSDRYNSDAWEETIETYLKGTQEAYAALPDREKAAVPCHVKMGEILSCALNLETGRWGQTEQNRAARCLLRLGWERFTFRPIGNDGKKLNPVRGYRPSTDPGVSTDDEVSTAETLTTKGPEQSVDSVDTPTPQKQIFSEKNLKTQSSSETKNILSTVSTLSTEQNTITKTSVSIVDTLVDTPRNKEDCLREPRLLSGASVDTLCLQSGEAAE